MIKKVSTKFEKSEEMRGEDGVDDESDFYRPTVAAKQLAGDIVQNCGLADGASGNGFVLRRSIDEGQQENNFARPLRTQTFLNDSMANSVDAGNRLKQNEMEVNKDEEELARRAAQLQKDMSDLQERKLRLKLAKLEQRLRKDALNAIKSLEVETQLVVDEKITDYREKCMCRSDALRATELDLTKKIEEMVRIKRGVEQQRVQLQEQCQLGVEGWAELYSYKPW